MFKKLVSSTEFQIALSSVGAVQWRIQKILVGGMIKLDKLCIISKFRMFRMNVLDLARTCWGIVLIRTIPKTLDIIKFLI